MAGFENLGHEEFRYGTWQDLKTRVTRIFYILKSWSTLMIDQIEQKVIGNLLYIYIYISANGISF